MKTLLLAAASWSLFSISAIADSDIPQRPATVAEKDFYKRMGEAVKKTMPALPAGWAFVSDQPVEIPEQVAVGSEKDMLPLEYSWDIMRSDRDAKMDALTRKLAEKQGTIERDSAGAPKGVEPLMARMEQISLKMAAEAENGNVVQATKYQAEMEMLSAQIQKLQAGALTRSAVPMSEQRALIGDTTARIEVKLNQTHFSMYGEAKKAAPVGGATNVYRAGPVNPNQAELEGQTVVYLGSWTPDSGQGYNGKAIRGRPHTSVHNLAISVHAEEKRAAALLKSMNFAVISSWVK